MMNALLPGEKARVQKLLLKGGIRRRLLDLGLTANTKVECVGKSFAGDPRAYLIRGAVIAVRNSDAEKIIVEKCL